VSEEEVEPTAVGPCRAACGPSPAVAVSDKRDVVPMWIVVSALAFAMLAVLVITNVATQIRDETATVQNLGWVCCTDG
jgi:hypothetical protein